MGYDAEKALLALPRPAATRRSFATPVLCFLSVLAVVLWLRPSGRLSLELSWSCKQSGVDLTRCAASAHRLFHIASPPSFTPLPQPPSEGAGTTHDPNACKLWPGWRDEIPTNAPVDWPEAPTTFLGSAEMLGGSPERGCIPAARRLGALGYGGRHGSSTQPWSSIKWGAVQSTCAAKHFDLSAASPVLSKRKLAPLPELSLDELRSLTNGTQPKTGRTAAVVRVWDDHHFSQNTLAWLRTVISELSLDNSGEYQVFLLVRVRNGALDLSDDSVYSDILARSVPAEFRDMALLYNHNLLRLQYPKVGDHSTRDQAYQALQVFSQTFPEFDYLWQLELDVRFTGNIAHMLSNAVDWATERPRKGLWERNAQFYIPGLWRSYDEFTAFVNHKNEDQGVWGPPPTAHHYVSPRGPTPPPRDVEAWGVGEPADLITFAPLVDPAGTNWTHERQVAGFGAGAATALPRRASPSRLVRVSRRLLALVAADQRAAGAALASDATPGSWALLHGLKAVYVPALVAFDERARAGLAPHELDALAHKGPAGNRAGGPAAGFLRTERFGLREPRWRDASFFGEGAYGQRLWWLYTNGTCLPQMILHPVADD